MFIVREYGKNEIALRSDDLDKVCEFIIENGVDKEYYNDMLDECYGEVDICSYKWSPSIALERIDPVAYNCGFNDYKDSLYSDLKYELERLTCSEEFYGYEIEIEEEYNER